MCLYPLSRKAALRRKHGLWNQIDMGVNLRVSINLHDSASLTMSRHKISLAELFWELHQLKYVKVHRPGFGAPLKEGWQSLLPVLVFLLPLPGWVTEDNVLHLSGPQAFFHLSKQISYTSLMELLQRSSEVRYIRWQEWHLVPIGTQAMFVSFPQLPVFCKSPSGSNQVFFF